MTYGEAVWIICGALLAEFMKKRCRAKSAFLQVPVSGKLRRCWNQFGLLRCYGLDFDGAFCRVRHSIQPNFTPVLRIICIISRPTLN